MIRTRELIRALPSYHPPLAGRAGLRLDFNENTVGCSPRVLERLRHLTVEDLARYPERHAVEEKLAEFLGVGAGELLLTNGVDEAIHLLCEAFLGADDEALIIAPTYSMYRIYMMAAGAQVREIRSGPDFQFPVNQLGESITDRTKLIAIANPNNPTGTMATLDELRELASSVPSVAVLVDEAYFEFCGQTALALRRECPNIFVTRTFSKAYGLAGLRVGALIGDRDHTSSIRLACSPYNVNAVALACLPAAIEDGEYVGQYVNDVLQSRTCLERFLREQGIQFWPSQANFVLFRVGPTREDAKAFAECMRKSGILVRDRSSDYGCEGCVRVTLGTREQTDRLLDAMQQAMAAIPLHQGAARK